MTKSGSILLNMWICRQRLIPALPVFSVTHKLPLFGGNEVSFGLKDLVHHWQYIRVTRVCVSPLPVKAPQRWEETGSLRAADIMRSRSGWGRGLWASAGELSPVRDREREHCLDCQTLFQAETTVIHACTVQDCNPIFLICSSWYSLDKLTWCVL